MKNHSARPGQKTTCSTRNAAQRQNVIWPLCQQMLRERCLLLLCHTIFLYLYLPKHTIPHSQTSEGTTHRLTSMQSNCFGRLPTHSTSPIIAPELVLVSSIHLRLVLRRFNAQQSVCCHLIIIVVASFVVKQHPQPALQSLSPSSADRGCCSVHTPVPPSNTSTSNSSAAGCARTSTLCRCCSHPTSTSNL